MYLKETPNTRPATRQLIKFFFFLLVLLPYHLSITISSQFAHVTKLDKSIENIQDYLQLQPTTHQPSPHPGPLLGIHPAGRSEAPLISAFSRFL